MKKLAVAVVVLAAAFIALSIANAQFGNVKVPTSTSDVKSNIDSVEYDQCNGIAKSYDNNVKFNSTNIKKELDSKKQLSYLKTSKDWTASKSKYDKENKVFDVEYKCMTGHLLKANCNVEKCNLYVNKM